MYFPCFFILFSFYYTLQWNTEGTARDQELSWASRCPLSGVEGVSLCEPPAVALAPSCSFHFCSSQTRGGKNSTATKHHSAYSGIKLARPHQGPGRGWPTATAQMVGESLSSPLMSKPEASLQVAPNLKGQSDKPACSAEHLCSGSSGCDSLSVPYLVCSAPQSSLSTHTLLSFMKEQGS